MLTLLEEGADGVEERGKSAAKKVNTNVVKYDIIYGVLCEKGQSLYHRAKVRVTAC